MFFFIGSVGCLFAFLGSLLRVAAGLMLAFVVSLCAHSVNKAGEGVRHVIHVSRLDWIFGSVDCVT